MTYNTFMPMILKKTAFLFTFIICISTLFAQNRIVKNVQHIRFLITESKYDLALKKLDNIERYRKNLDNDTINAFCTSLRGLCFFHKQNYFESIPIFQQACLLFEKTKIREYDFLDCLLFTAIAYHRLENFDKAERYYRKALIKSFTVNVEKVNVYRANIYLNLGTLYKKKGLDIFAEECFERAQFDTATLVAKIDVDRWNFLTWQNSLWEKIQNHISNQRYQEAVDVYSEMISGIEEKIGKGDEYAFALHSKAILLRAYLNKYDEAMRLYKEVIELKDILSPACDEDVCSSYCNYTLCLAIGYNFIEIEHMLPSAISYLLQVQNEKYPVNSIYRFIGNGSYWNNDYEHAITYYEKYLDPIFPKEDGNSYDEITNMLAVSYIHTNKLDKAQDLLLNYIRTNTKKINNDKGLAANIYHNLGLVYMLKNNYSDALKFLGTSIFNIFTLYFQTLRSPLNKI